MDTEKTSAVCTHRLVLPLSVYLKKFIFSQIQLGNCFGSHKILTGFAAFKGELLLLCPSWGTANRALRGTEAEAHREGKDLLGLAVQELIVVIKVSTLQKTEDLKEGFGLEPGSQSVYTTLAATSRTQFLLLSLFCLFSHRGQLFQLSLQCRKRTSWITQITEFDSSRMQVGQHNSAFIQHSYLHFLSFMEHLEQVVFGSASRMSSALTDPRECQKVKAVMLGNHFLLISLSWTQLLPRPEKTFLEKNNAIGYQVIVCLLLGQQCFTVKHQLIPKHKTTRPQRVPCH